MALIIASQILKGSLKPTTFMHLSKLGWHKQGIVGLRVEE